MGDGRGMTTEQVWEDPERWRGFYVDSCHIHIHNLWGKIEGPGVGKPTCQCGLLSLSR